ncbi:MAG: T9SS type A sorting domain-containing protein [Bacteroidetes bacterium]|nr:MAG: T9SS type A sorting domain-containing protein [Bacteroidota bacterium]
MPNDYSIIFYPDIVDTSLADTLYPNTPSNRLPATPVSFHVKNLSTNQFVDFCYRKNSFSSSTNYVIYFKEQLFSKLTRTWSVTLFFNGANAPLPTADTLYLYTKKGFSMFDTIRVFGVTTGIGDNPQLPNGYSLEQNYPNPFNPSTVIRYSLPVANHVLLKIYDILGREIATLVNETKPAGSYNVTWDASGLPSGIYFYRMQAGSFIQNKKLLLIK